MKTTILSTNCIHCSLRWSALLFVSLLIGCFAISPMAQAVSPAPDGGYPNGNTAEGTNALFSLTNGGTNTGIGVNALFSLRTGSQNTAVGANALKNNMASQNTAVGVQALVNNTSGSDNTANGALALVGNSTGNNNVANGFEALLSNTTGYQNTANGEGALYGNTTGGANTALGIDAGNNLTTGNGNVCIGAFVGGVAGESNTTRIRNVYGSAVSGLAVYVDSGGRLGHLSSSRRYKEEIKPMEKASDALLALKPVTFRYKKEIDPDRIPQFGIVAEEVEKVDSGLG